MTPRIRLRKRLAVSIAACFFGMLAVSVVERYGLRGAAALIGFALAFAGIGGLVAMACQRRPRVIEQANDADALREFAADDPVTLLMLKGARIEMHRGVK